MLSEINCQLIISGYTDTIGTIHIARTDGIYHITKITTKNYSIIPLKKNILTIKEKNRLNGEKNMGVYLTHRKLFFIPSAGIRLENMYLIPLIKSEKLEVKVKNDEKYICILPFKDIYVLDGNCLKDIRDNEFVKYDTELNKYVLCESYIIREKDPTSYLISLSNNISSLTNRKITGICFDYNNNFIIKIHIGDMGARRYKHFCLSKTRNSFKVVIKKKRDIVLYILEA